MGSPVINREPAALDATPDAPAAAVVVGMAGAAVRVAMLGVLDAAAAMAGAVVAGSEDHDGGTSSVGVQTRT